MTVISYEVTAVQCDNCGDQLEAKFHPDFENVFESELWWFESLKKEGWRYIKGHDTHYCPECEEED